MKYRILICYWLSCFGVQCLDECWHDNKLLLRVQAYKDVYSPMTFKCNLNLKVNRTEEVSLALTIVMEKKIKYKYSSFCTSIFCPVSYKSKFESCENHVRKRCHFVHSTLYHFFTRVWARSQCVEKYQICLETANLCSPSVKNEPTWPCPEELKFEETKPTSVV